jgi:protein-disulfide isomerase
MILLLGLAGFLGIAAAIVLVLVARGGGSDSSSNVTTLPDSNVIAQMFRGIPQRGNVLGKPTAPVTMVEYIDLQCPVCRAFETDVMPTIIDRFVRTGELKVEARTIAFIGPDSDRGRKAAIAAAEQNRFFNFTQLLYFNQGPENSGWLDDSMVESAASSIPGVDVQALKDAAGSSAAAERAREFDQQATADNVTGTPAVYIGKTGGKLTPVTPGSAPGVQDVQAALQKALR